jgi:hypothetical protein
MIGRNAFTVLTLLVSLNFIKCDTSNAVTQATRSNKTTWDIVNSSLSDLLNNGWKLIAQSSDRAATPPVPGNSVSGSGTPAFDEQSFVYTLYKEGKYVTCTIRNPSPGNSYSRCRLIN